MPNVTHAEDEEAKERRREQVRRAAFKHYHRAAIIACQQDLEYLHARLPEIKNMVQLGAIPIYIERALLDEIAYQKAKLNEHKLKLATMAPRPIQYRDPRLEFRSEAAGHRRIQQQQMKHPNYQPPDTGLDFNDPEVQAILEKYKESDQ